MCYSRLYPTKNNTIFQYYDNSLTPYSWSTDINCGANPIMELQDGKGYSRLLFSFDIPDWLKTKLEIYSYTVKFKLFDAGTLFTPAINLKEVSLFSFPDDFAEGDGYSFLKEKGKNGLSNFNERLDGESWNDVTFTPVLTYHLNLINEDLSFDITSSIQSYISVNNPSPKYALNITSPEPEKTNIYTKFIYSRHTRTVFQPYLEFVIHDEIQDSHNLLTGGVPNRLYLLNQNQEDFVGTLTATVILENDSIVTPTIQHEDTGIYFIEVTPPIPANNLTDEFVTVQWFINGNMQYKELIKVQSPNQIFTKRPYDLNNLFYYPITPYTNNIVRKGDLMPFEVISEIRGYGKIVDTHYDFKVISADGFEMVPWSPVSVYKEKMFFILDTSFFFPELQYEVFIRNKTRMWSRTSHLTYKFKVVQDAQSHLRELSASPYYSRDYFFSK